MRKGIAATAIIAALLAFVPWQPVMALRLPPLLIDSPLAKKLGFIGGGRALGLGVTITASSCTDTIVNAAIVSAMSGDTVVIPPGTCTWSTHDAIGFYYQPNITLQGSGTTVAQGAATTGGTTIDATSLNGFHAFAWRDITHVGGGRMTNIHFICAQILVEGPGWRIDHNTFECHQHNYQIYTAGILADNTNSDAYNQLTSPLNGLIDNNKFIDLRVLAFRLDAGTFGENTGSTTWSESLGLGTTDAVYVEDNDFHFESFQNVIDCQGSGKFVFRFNTVEESYLETHPAIGGPSGGTRGCRKWEVYNNTFTQSALEVSQPLTFRGGTGVFFNNTYVGAFGNGQGNFQINRATQDFGGFGLCNGTNPWDGNQDATGWPCLDQIGRGTDNTGPFNGSPPPYTPQPQSSEPAYFWNNKMNGSAMTFGSFDSQTAARLVLNRDYFVSVSVAKPNYTQLIHPHPLQGAGPALPRPATGVIVTPAGGH